MSRSLCKYKNALGIPQKGFHAQRVKIGTKDFALYDILVPLCLLFYSTNCFFLGQIIFIVLQ